MHGYSTTPFVGEDEGEDGYQPPMATTVLEQGGSGGSPAMEKDEETAILRTVYSCFGESIIVSILSCCCIVSPDKHVIGRVG